MVTKRKVGMRAPLVLLVVLALGVVATTHSADSVQPSAPVNQLAKLTTQAVHDRSASLRGLAPQPAEAPVSEEVLERAAGLSQGTEIEPRNVAPQPGLPDAGAAEQTSFGPRPAIATVTSFDNGLNGGSTSDNNIAAGPDSIVVMRNSQFKVMSKTGATLLGPLNNNSIFAGVNEVQQVALSGYTADGAAYRLNYDGAESVPITRGQNNTAAGIQAALQGGNEQQQVTLTNFTGTSSYSLKYGDAVSTPFVRGTNHTAAAILSALNGTSEVQTVAPDRRPVQAQLRGSRDDPDRSRPERHAGRNPERAAGRQRGPDDHVLELQRGQPGEHVPDQDRREPDRAAGLCQRARRRDAGHQPERQRRDQCDLRLRRDRDGHGREQHDGPDDHVRRRERRQGRAAGRDRVRRLRGALPPTPCTATNREAAKAAPPVTDWPRRHRGDGTARSRTPATR